MSKTISPLTHEPGTILGYRASGAPIFAIAGASPDGDEPDGGGDEGTPDPDASTDDEGSTGADEGEAGGSDDEGGESRLSHEDALSALAKTRRSEAKYRTRLREAEEALGKAKTPEEFEAALDEIRENSAKDQRELLAENTALKFGLPNELAAMLTGSTREELEASAKVLAKHIVTEQPDPENLNGGLGGNNDDEPFDPRANARKNRRR